jgi:hypothetical protein
MLRDIGQITLRLRNDSPGPRIIYDVGHREVFLRPGEVHGVTLAPAVADSLYSRPDLRVLDSIDDWIEARAAAPMAWNTALPPLYVVGMLGFGDNLHQRAVLRELMRTHAVTLATCHGCIYHDLVDQGLTLTFQRAHLRTQAKLQAREMSLMKAPVPTGIETRRIFYGKTEIDRCGTIMGAMFGSVGLPVPERPEFSLPVPEAWRTAIRVRMPATRGRPIMIHRPVTLRREWWGHARNPDLAAYDALYNAIAGRFFVISIADIEPNAEWIDGPPFQRADHYWHKGELSFPEIAALFCEAAMVFSPAGMSPILAQAVGTPVVVVYGGHESSRTTDRAGAHLAPTLMIDPDRPCDCHTHRHGCDKRISLAPAVERLAAFVDGLGVPPGKAVHVPDAIQPPVAAPGSKPPVWPPVVPGRAVPRVAIVVGGAASVWTELDAAEALCREAGEEPVRIAINDLIAMLPGSIVAASLHHHQLPIWIKDRETRGFPAPTEIWARYRPSGFPVHISHIANDWGGSGGLYGVAVALQRGHARVICVGVPMEPSVNHIVRGTPWTEALRYRKGWDDHLGELRGRVRSMAGWTAGRLGVPDAEWLSA